MLPGVRESRDGILVDLQVVPSSRKEEIRYDPEAGRLRVKVSAPADKGKANKAVTKKLSNLFGNCEIVEGLLSRKKTVLVRGKNYGEIEKMLK